jgi:hypothetical protein
MLVQYHGEEQQNQNIFSAPPKKVVRIQQIENYELSEDFFVSTYRQKIYDVVPARNIFKTKNSHV